MNRLLVLFCALLSAVSVRADKGSLERAGAAAGPGARLAYTAVSDGHDDFYVFNRPGGRGFEVIIADENVRSGEELVLAYSDEGTFDYATLPDGAKWLLKQYQTDIRELRSSQRHTGLRGSSAAAKAPGAVAGPLLGGINWNQQTPYNDMCPYFPSSGQKCITGCLATAVAQIMYYHKWPLRGAGSHSYTWQGRKLSADFTTPYDWENMLPMYTSGYSDVEAKAVAKLMSDCGIALEMNYGIDASDAMPSAVSYAMRVYFRYRNAEIVRKATVSASTWENTIKGNLDRGLPVLYVGYDSSNAGHAFVCDGYDDKGYLHFNFGWGGLGNGYFLSSVAGGYGGNQCIICNIEPDDNEIAVGKVNYLRLGDTEVEVSSLQDNYGGDIMLPEYVNIDGNRYAVSRIGQNAFAGSSVSSVVIPSTIRIIEGNAFMGCNSLNRVVIMSEPPVCSPNLFDNDTYSRATLYVASGKTDSFASQAPWYFFHSITDTDVSIDWTEWTYDRDGTGTYNFSWTGLMPDASVNLPVLFRTGRDDPSELQYKIDNWLNTSLLIDVNAETGMCRVRRQPVWMCVDDRYQMCVSDYGSFGGKDSYEDYPCRFDPETGTFTLNMVFYPMSDTGNRYYFKGMDTFSIDGYPVSLVPYVNADRTADDVIFDLYGRRLAAPASGLNIINGVKVLR